MSILDGILLQIGMILGEAFMSIIVVLVVIAIWLLIEHRRLKKND